ncbi:MAG TPA: flagellar hook-associated protein FlgL [Scandinavium sp.]|jgi:flagellar hook-associated protein 3 FlgL
MRISSRYNSQAMLAQMNTNNERLSKLMEQMSTQKRVNVPSDDPVAATRLVQLNREQSAIKQYQENISRVSGTLSVQESHIKAMSDNLLAINDKLLSANNSTYSQKDMAGYGVELGSMLDSLVDSLNAQNENGSYLFSGTKTNTKPVVLDEATGKYVYQGNDGTRSTTVANSITIQENTNAASAFSSGGNDLEMLNQLKDLSEKMQDPNANFSDYQPQIQQVLELESDSRDKVSSMFTDLGGRQNQLTLLDNAHTDVSLANDQVVHDLSDTDWAATSMNMQLYVNSVQISNKAYSMVSQLSLFDTM